MRRTCASILCLFALTSPARAEDRLLRLSEAEFIEQYQQSEPRLRISEANIQDARADVADARLFINPQLRYEREAVGGNAESNAGLALTLDLGGRGARIESAQLRVRAATRAAEYQRWRLLVDALVAYYGAVRARERVALLDAERAPLADIVRLLRTRAGGGENSGYDRDRIELELVRHDERLAEARGAYALARLRLGRLLGQVEVEPTSPLSGELAVDRSPEEPALAAAAVRERTDWRAARARVEAAGAAADAAGRWWIPRIALAGGVRTIGTGGTGGATGGQGGTGYFFGATLEIPVFDRNQGARRRAAAARIRAQATTDYLAATIPGAVREARAMLLDRLRRLEQVRAEQLPRAERLVARAALIYREGESDVVALTDAHRTVLEVRERHLALLYQVKLAQLEVWRALGRRPEGGAP